MERILANNLNIPIRILKFRVRKLDKLARVSDYKHVIENFPNSVLIDSNLTTKQLRYVLLTNITDVELQYNELLLDIVFILQYTINKLKTLLARGDKTNVL